MNLQFTRPCSRRAPAAHGARLLRAAVALSAATLTAVSPAHASLFSGDTLDLVANILAWVVLFIAPAIGIAVFWLVHILPERIAEKRHHPQAPAIKTLCMLSLFFGGLLWPLAWLWAYSRPVLYKMAYGVDTVPPEHDEPHDTPEVKDDAHDEHDAEVTVEPAPRLTRAAGGDRRPWEN